MLHFATNPFYFHILSAKIERVLSQILQYLRNTAGVEGLAIGGKIACGYGACAVADALAGLGKVYAVILAHIPYPVVGITYHYGSELIRAGIVVDYGGDGAADDNCIGACVSDTLDKRGVVVFKGSFVSLP